MVENPEGQQDALRSEAKGTEGEIERTGFAEPGKRRIRKNLTVIFNYLRSGREDGTDSSRSCISETQEVNQTSEWEIAIGL